MIIFHFLAAGAKGLPAVKLGPVFAAEASGRVCSLELADDRSAWLPNALFLDQSREPGCLSFQEALG